jgi:hypothetical protein
VRNRQATLPCRLTLIHGDQRLGEPLPAPPPNTALHEGLNEHDYPSRSAEDWLPKLQQHQQLLPGPSVAPAFVYASSYRKCECPADHANGHPYPGGRWETSAHAQQQLDLSRSAVDAPALATEWGYHTTAPGGWHAPGHDPVTEPQQRDRTIAGIFELLKTGWQQVYLYELVDLRAGNHQEHRFGLYRNDWTPKPVAKALAWTLSKVGDGHQVEPTVWANNVRSSEWLLPSGDRAVVLWRTSDGSTVAELWDRAGGDDYHRYRAYRADGTWLKGADAKNFAVGVGHTPVVVFLRAR